MKASREKRDGTIFKLFDQLNHDHNLFYLGPIILERWIGEGAVLEV